MSPHSHHRQSPAPAFRCPAAHRRRQGSRGRWQYPATIAAAAVVLVVGMAGPALAQTAGPEGLQAANEVFIEEARDMQPECQPGTVSADGWASTHQAWQALLREATIGFRSHFR